MELPDGWKVIKVIERGKRSTGGHFSQGYVVESKAGRLGFLKALDYSGALGADDPARELQRMTESYNFERDVVAKCRDGHLDRVVLGLAEGTVRVDGEPVQYLIFELADGDARAQADEAERYELVWFLRALHHVATGLFQLHREGIAHQDVKPSNVLAFEDGKISKVADLGRAAYRGHFAPHEDYTVAGDYAYAPPELLYGYADPDWPPRRLGCDTYLMGSMVVFFTVGVGMTTLIRSELREAQSWGVWTGTYAEVLPYLRDAFERAVRIFEAAVDPKVKRELTTAVRELCDPDPRHRGHPLNRTSRGNQYSLERYVSLFNLLARKAELGVLGERHN